MWIRPSWVALLQRSHYWGRRATRREVLGLRNTRISHQTSGNLNFGLMCPNLRSLVPPTMSLWAAEKVSGRFLHVWFPPWSMEEEVWWCGAALLVALLVIYLKFKAHWTSMVTTASCSHMPSHLVLALVGPSFVFNRTMTPNTPPGFVMASWPRRRVMECYNTIQLLFSTYSKYWIPVLSAESLQSVIKPR